jgi:hypothetical protein
MASWNAIAATSRAILGLLEDAYPRDGFGRLSFTLVQPSDFGEEADFADGYTLCLYRVVPGSQRNLPPRMAPDGRRYRPSLPVDLHYLLTPWGESVEKQQMLLGWGMRRLEDESVLPAGVLNRHLREADVFHPDEAVELVLDPLPLPDFTSIWDKLKPAMQTSVTYAARGVRIDSELEIREGEPVQTRVFELAEVRK